VARLILKSNLLERTQNILRSFVPMHPCLIQQPDIRNSIYYQVNQFLGINGNFISQGYFVKVVTRERFAPAPRTTLKFSPHRQSTRTMIEHASHRINKVCTRHLQMIGPRMKPLQSLSSQTQIYQNFSSAAIKSIRILQQL
jgi:hypothetical protein